MQSDITYGSALGARRRGRRPRPAFSRFLIERLAAGDYVNVKVRQDDDLGWREARELTPGDLLLLPDGADPYALQWPVTNLDVLVIIRDDALARRCCAALIDDGARLAVAVPQLFVHKAVRP